jgi:hypothetical protein
MDFVDDQSTDQGERFRVHVLDEDDVGPPDGTAVEVCDEKALIVAGQDSRQAGRRVAFRQVITELSRQLRNLAGI